MTKPAAEVEPHQSVLIVDDDQVDAQKLSEAFGANGEVILAHDVESATEALKAWPDLVVLDAVFPRRPDTAPAFLAGEMLDAIENVYDEEGREPPDVVLVSGQKEAADQFSEIARWLDAGRIRDVLPKSVANAGWLIFQVILRHKANALRRERHLRGALRAAEGAFSSLADNGIVTSDERLALKLWDDITHAAEKGRNFLARGEAAPNIFIHGETGTGKELVAKAIANLVGRELLSINCAATPSELFESEFYGTVAGAHSDAHDREGLIEKAARKVLNMDEVCKLLPRHQMSLLRVTDKNIREFRRVGETRLRKAACLFVFSDSIPIWDAVKRGDFSAELAYRLTGIEIELPPLRARWSADGRPDARLLTRHFLDRYNAERRKNVRLTEEVYDVFEGGHWPGNVRALEDFVNNIVDKSDGLVTFEQVREKIGEQKLAMQLGDRPARPAAGSPHRRPTADVALPAGPRELLDALAEELSDPEPGTWLKLGERSGRKDSEREHEHEPLLRQALALLFGHAAVGEVQDALRARNNPRRVNVYKALLYLKLHPEHRAELDDFGRITDLRSWLSKKRIGDALAELSRILPVRAEEDRNRYTYWLD